MVNIENMTNDEWINYRENLLSDYVKAGYKLIPNEYCPMCEVEENYTCFECEIHQLNDKGF
jgi:hypothetical protein